MAIKKRCVRCLTLLDTNGNCTNEKCVRYKPATKAKKVAK